MKNLAIVLSVAFLLTGCKKLVEKKEEDAIMKAMTDGHWVITSFINNGVDVTTDFSPYIFQYFDNYTVDAVKNGTLEKTGTWQGDVNTMNISATFPGATNPLLLLNGVWHVTDNGWTFVEATQSQGGEVRTLRLDKQ